MSNKRVKEIANAVLYEGYLLYPYRRSAIKNRQRWTFGVVYPRDYSEAQGGIEPWLMQTECLLTGTSESRIAITVRFLHLLLHHASVSDGAKKNSSGAKSEVWEEGIEREFEMPDLLLADLLCEPCRMEITIAGESLTEQALKAAETRREVQPLRGSIVITARVVAPDLCAIKVQIENTTPIEDASTRRYYDILPQTFVSTHTILQVRHGAFVSLFDPPVELREQARRCQNIRTWPVLVGETGDYTTMLSSPIILYDYPQIAPESPGSLFDGTEIDELLTLRILTLSDEEKEEIRRGDKRGRELLERCESLTPDQLMQLHGTIRDVQRLDPSAADKEQKLYQHPNTHPGEDYPPPSTVRIGKRLVRAGDRVRLHPKARADAFDFLLAGRIGRVEVIQQDFENRLYLVVTLDDDPGREQWDERVMPGHRFFFFPEEVEPIDGIEEVEPVEDVP